VNGNCLSNGSCNCTADFLGKLCDTSCFDKNCLISCICDDKIECTGSSKICNNNIYFFDQSAIVVSAVITIIGEIELSNSSLNLNSSQLYLRGDLSLINVSLTLSNSMISVNGCIYLNDSHIVVDLSNFTKNLKTQILISEDHCLNSQSTTITYVNQPNCFTEQTTIDQSNVIVNLLATSCNLKTPPSIALWIPILIGSFVVLAIIVIVIIMVVPSLRLKIFPIQGARKFILSKTKKKKGDKI